ncbi:hypothetical protein LIER_02311 [Lithospermum erythrorhizon]|uniref:Uncharacterized protein n=1 Tax=Lithospermum erythrorhizon TaxID=34254 RepID=A0AAV3NQI6_LITER
MAQAVASRLSDAKTGENPRDSDVLFAEPLAVRQPLSSTTKSSQAHTTPSSSQTAAPAQAGTNADKPVPLFFNMHTTSHSGPLTSFPAARNYNIFDDPKIDKVTEARWHSNGVS